MHDNKCRIPAWSRQCLKQTRSHDTTRHASRAALELSRFLPVRLVYFQLSDSSEPVRVLSGGGRESWNYICIIGSLVPISLLAPGESGQ